ncbi:MAG: TPM domain-containing protein [Tissierellia bacterium]|nr:TPM domain-containing protein [Tissierellia bacterium]
MRNTLRNKLNILVLIVIILNAVISPVSVKAISDFDYGRLPEQSREFYIYDEIGILSQDAKDYIFKMSRELDENTNAQVVVAIVEDLDGLDIDSYATRLFEKWKIGSKEKDEGILLVVKPKFSSSDKGYTRIEVGYGLEHVIIASYTKDIINNYMIPEFVNENYEDGILNGYNRILMYLSDYYDYSFSGTGDSDIQKNTVTTKDEGISLTKIILLLILLYFISGGGGRSRRNWSTWYYVGRQMGRGGGFGGYRGSGGGFGGSGGFRGGGGRSGGGGGSGSW